MAKPTLLGTGRTADVFALDEHRVLRRYRIGVDAGREAGVMKHVAAHGFAAPEVYSAAGADLVMARVTGPTMLQALLAGDLTAQAGAELLAQLHGSLHRVPAYRSGDPAHRVLHLDLHPDNVMLSERGPVVIDWTNTEDGPPELDLAMTAIILGQVACAGTPGLAAEVQAAVGVFLDAFLAAAGDGLLAGLDGATDRRRQDPNLSRVEIDALADAAGLIRERLA